MRLNLVEGLVRPLVENLSTALGVLIVIKNGKPLISTAQEKKRL